MDTYDRSGYCGKCLCYYTRKKNWLRHFDQPHVLGVKGIGWTANLCYGHKKPRVWEKTKEEADSVYKLAKRSESFFQKTSASAGSSQSGSESAKVKENLVPSTSGKGSNRPHENEIDTASGSSEEGHAKTGKYDNSEGGEDVQ